MRRVARFLRRRPRCDVLFLCSATIDEVWVRSTARACNDQGLRVRLAVCDDGGDQRPSLEALYSGLGIPVDFGISYAAAAEIRCRIAVTASSDLNREIFPTAAGSFVHMPHSLASLHMVYPAGAFDGYDVLFAAGPHHVAEFEALTAARRLRNRGSVPAGYGKLDVLREGLSKAGTTAAGRHVLIAPSWGPDNLLNRCGVGLAGALADAGYRVTIRPHPLFMLEAAPVVAELRALAERESAVRIESSLEGDGAIFDADLMIGDYSGTSFEFAALRRRPVVSANVGQKIANPEWTELGLTPIEVGYRERLGPVVDPSIDAILAGVAAAGAFEIDESVITGFLFDPSEGFGPHAAALLKDMLTAQG